MTAVAHDDLVKFYWVPSVASIAAPTVAEIAAGTRIPSITNYTMNGSENEVDFSDIDTLAELSGVGTTKVGPITLTMKRDDDDETDTYDLFDTPRTNGFLIRSPFGLAIAGSKVEVYPAQYGKRRNGGYGRNAPQTFDVTFYVTEDANESAVVAA